MPPKRKNSNDDTPLGKSKKASTASRRVPLTPNTLRRIILDSSDEFAPQSDEDDSDVPLPISPPQSQKGPAVGKGPIKKAPVAPSKKQARAGTPPAGFRVNRNGLLKPVIDESVQPADQLPGRMLGVLATAQGPTAAPDNSIGIALKEPCRHDEPLTAATTGIMLLHQHSHDLLSYGNEVLREISANVQQLVRGFAKLHGSANFEPSEAPATKQGFTPGLAGQRLNRARAIPVLNSHTQQILQPSAYFARKDKAKAQQSAAKTSSTSKEAIDDEKPTIAREGARLYTDSFPRDVGWSAPISEPVAGGSKWAGALRMSEERDLGSD